MQTESTVILVYRPFSQARRFKFIVWQKHPLNKNYIRAACAAVFIVAAFSAAASSNVRQPDELEQRLQQQRNAVRSSNPAEIISTSQKLIARALLELGKWRSRENASAQALALFRISLSLEDLPETRELIADADAKSDERVQIFAADPIDPASASPESDIAKAKLPPGELRQGKLREKHLRRVLGIGYNDWGTADANQGRYSKALVEFKEAERWDPSTPDLMRNLGMAAIKVGDKFEAVRDLQVAVEQNAQDKPLRSLLAISQFSVGDYKDAAKSFSLVPDLAFADPNMAYAWAFSLFRSNQIRQSVSMLEQLSRRRLSPEMLVPVGRLYTELGEYQRALESFHRALVEDPSFKNAHRGAGVALIRMDRPAEAVSELQAELKINPDDPDAQYQLAFALLQLSRKDEAIALLRSLVASHPDHSRAHYQLGKEMLESGQIEDAITNLDAAAKLDPDSAYVHYQLQAAYRRAGKTSDANRELQVYRQLKERDRQRVSIGGAHEGKPTE